MTAFNIVRFRVKPGREADFIRVHEEAQTPFGGLRAAHLVDAGNRTFFFVGEWDRFGDIAAARPGMIAILDRFRDMVEDLGDGKGVTDPFSGTSVVEMRP